MRNVQHRLQRLFRRTVFALACAIPITGVARAPLAAQQSLTLEQAVSMALLRAPSVGMARADSAAAQALVSQARAIPNPTVTAQYTKSTPQRHLEVDQPLVFPWIRSARVAASGGGARAATLRLTLERAVLVHDVQVAYAQAAAAGRRRDLSAESASDALELVDIATRRLAAGDAAELEVALARVAAGDYVNQASSDSLAAVSSVLDLQLLIGEPVDRVTVELADSLSLPPAAAPAEDVSPLAVSAAQADVEASQAALSLARRSRLPAPDIVAGFESHDVVGDEPGILPLFGVSLSIPLFNQSGGEIGQARAELDRARGALELAERQSAVAMSIADRQRRAARARAQRDQTLLDDAERVATLSNRAYEEGAFPLTSVIEAQRSVRDARIRYVEDLSAARIAEADYVLATQATEAP